MYAFLHMGGYGGFIWPAYGIVAAVLIGLLVTSRRFARSSADELAALNPRSRRQNPERGDET